MAKLPQKITARKVVFVVGPTSSGKTDLAVKLARFFGGELISADSRQVYQGLDIGTGKEGESQNSKGKSTNQNSKVRDRRLNFIKSRARWIGKTPQYLIDIATPGEGMYNLAYFLRDAKLIMQDIWSRGLLPIVVGGTGLYVSALSKGYVLPLKKQARGEWHKQVSPNFESLIIGLDVSRKNLYSKIDKRLKQRLEQGLVKEARELIDQGVSPRWLVKIGLEYRYTSWFLQGKIASPGELYNKLRFAIHAYAKRQLTWLRHQVSRVEWVTTSGQAACCLVRFNHKNLKHRAKG